MSGGDNGVRDHRRWWNGLVSSVAYAPSARLSTPSPASEVESDRVDRAPLASLVDGIGAATPDANASGIAGTRSSWLMLLFAVLAFGLVAEVASRRMRGAA
jgi:hypothetical protein